MIPDLPDGMTLEQEVKFYRQLWGNYSDQSYVHVKWFSHTGNPSICWICDLSALCSKVLELLETDLSKSTVDIETSLTQEDDSDSEIENDLNYDEEEPEDGQDI